jgi:ABC-type multidrug transport system ATPase subunit
MSAAVLTLAQVTLEVRRRGQRVRVVDGVSLELLAGEIVGLVGPAGAGASAVLRLAGGLLSPSAGAVRLGGAPADRHRGRRFAGFAPAHPVFPPTLTVRDVLDYLARLHVGDAARRRALVGTALELADLGSVANRRAARLPERWIARLGVAQAALGGRPLLLLDQTFAALDPLARRELGERLRGLAARGRAILVASHELATLERVAGRVVVLRRGAIVRSGPLVAVLGERVLEVVLDRPVERAPPGFRRTAAGLEMDLGGGTVEAALALCRAHRLAVRASRVRLKSLEDAVVETCHAPR